MALELRLLRYFSMVAEELSFTKAAERLFVTTPTLSAGIKSLEKILMVELFDRTPRAVKLTEAGRDLLPHANRILADSEALAERAALLAGTVRLRAGSISGFGGVLLKEAAKRLSTGGPNLELEMVITDWTEPTAGLQAGEADVAILVGPTSYDEDLVRFRLWDDELLAVIPSRSSLATRRSVSVDDLDEIGFLWCRAGDQIAHSFYRLDHLRPGPPDTAKEYNTPQELFLGIRSGEGVCCIPSGMVDQYGFAGLSLVPLRGSPTAPVDVARRVDRTAPLVDTLMATVVDIAGQKGSSLAVNA